MLKPVGSRNCLKQVFITTQQCRIFIQRNQAQRSFIGGHIADGAAFESHAMIRCHNDDSFELIFF